MENNKLKVALCLSGQPRFYNSSSFLSMKREIIDKYNTDVFIHTWISKNKDFEYPCAPWSSLNRIKIEGNIESDLIELYNPKYIQSEEPRIFREFLNETNEHDYLSNNMPSMFYSIKMVDDFRKKYGNQKYDFVVRARTDTLLKSCIDFNILEKDTIYIPDNCGNHLFFNDNFSICGGEIADNVYNIFDTLKLHYDYFSPETIWSEHLRSNNFKIEKIKIDQNFTRE